jgi:hypothetical protein
MRDALAFAFETKFPQGAERAVGKLVPYLVTLSPEGLLLVWRETLHTLATRTRQDLLEGLGAMAPVIFALGGADAVDETFRAIADVGRWWP